MKKILFSVVIIVMVSCLNQSKNKNKSESIVNKNQDLQKQSRDSLIIMNSKEHKRVIEFLNWYKKGYTELCLPSVEKHVESDTLNYAYIDTSKARNLLNRYRTSGFFSSNKINEDSLYIERAKKAYQKQDLEIYDYFDHDFILLTQEIKGTLNTIPNVDLLPNYCNLNTGKIAISIGNYVNLRYTLVKEDNLLKIDNIENLGIIKKSP